MKTGEALTCASRGGAVVDQLSTHRLDRHMVHLSRLQGTERHLVQVFEDTANVQLSALSEQKDRKPVHVSLTWRPGHLQTTAISMVTDVDVLHSAGN